VGRVISVWATAFRAALAPHIQAKTVNALARILREAFAELDFAVCDLGKKKGRLAAGIKDLRSPTAAAEENQAGRTRQPQPSAHGVWAHT